MAGCRNCPFYDAEYDSMKNELNDVIIEGQEYKEHHYCIMYDNHIDDFFIGEKQCEFEQAETP